MKREINILITVTEENDAYKGRLQTGNVLIKDFVIAMQIICRAIEEKGGKDEAKAALMAIIFENFGIDAVKEMYAAMVLSEKIEKKELDFLN